MNKKIGSLFLLLLFFMPIMQGQDLNQELKVLKDFNSEIYEPDPLFSFASIRTGITRNPNLLQDSLIRIARHMPDLELSIRPLAYERPEKEKQYHGFLRADKGTINPFAVSGAYVHAVDNYFSIETSGLYDHWVENSTDNQFITTGQASVGLRYYLNAVTLARVDVIGGRHEYGLYGFKGFSLDREDAKHSFDTFHPSISIESFREGSRQLNYRLMTSFKRTALRQRDNFQENDVDFKGRLNFNLDNRWAFTAQGSYETMSLPADQDMNSYEGMGAIRFNTAELFGLAGIRYIYSDNGARWFPEARIRARINQDITVEAEVLHRLKKYGLSAYGQINPYIDYDRADFILSYEKYYALKGEIVNFGFSNLTMSVAFNQVSDGLNFSIVNMPFSGFDVEELDYDQWTIGVDARRPVGHVLTIGLSASYDIFNSGGKTLYHRPKWNIAPMVGLELFEGRLGMEISGHFNQGQLIQSVTGVNELSKWRKDLSAGLRFNVHKRVNVYANVDNVLNDDFLLWSGHHVFGRNFSGGLMIKI